MAISKEEIYHAIQYLNQEFIPFPSFDAAIKAIFRNLELYRQTGIAEFIFIAGNSGAGKSSLCDWMKLQMPKAALPDRDIIPCLIVNVPSIANVAGIAEAMLYALGDPSPLTGKISAKTHRVITLIRALKVELIMFDEAQHCFDRGQQKTHYMVGDWIKVLIDELGIPIVFVGLPRFQQLLAVNEQLRRRISRKLNLALGQSHQGDMDAEVFQLFNSLAAGLQIPIVFEPFTWQEMGKRLYYASDGLVAYVKTLLIDALERALVLEESCISPELLEQVFKKNECGRVAKTNPFNPAFEFRRLDRLGEPFYTGGK